MYLKAETIMIIAAPPGATNLQYSAVCITEAQLWNTNKKKMVTLRSSDSYPFWGLNWHPIPKVGALRRCHRKEQAAQPITAKILSLGRTKVKSLVSACYSITCFSWRDPTSKRLRKWKRSHRTESAWLRNLRPPPGWWHLLGIVPVSF